ncbi:hypothetical protein GCM10011321_31330 [Youhaiella tibetensis]|uniref:Uncharacterized protein n=1 Tax=Paradevosia tibetensis TaxID=1447062 RepID=A0A5B9DJ91_9HYPH|nr:hypothetical protein [Youhaiella tibetensis]QEE18905.1 hypothetical protein FNA67_01350 [Youhaiella tibetensis]GGF38137.1 hypothetical protein GCM10011321_31330 [Youhaiella tibetensis]
MQRRAMGRERKITVEIQNALHTAKAVPVSAWHSRARKLRLMAERNRDPADIEGAAQSLKAEVNASIQELDQISRSLSGLALADSRFQDKISNLTALERELDATIAICITGRASSLASR